MHIDRAMNQHLGVPVMTSQLLTAQEVAERLRCKPFAVLKLCRSGKLRATKPGKSWLITEDAVEEYLQSGLNQPQDAA